MTRQQYLDAVEQRALADGVLKREIFRERLYAESRRRNRVLETIRTVLEALAGPEHVHAGTEGALAALRALLAR